MVIYWDTSAILSILVENGHSKKSIEIIKQKGFHLTSTLGIAETYAVLKRMRHERILTSILYESAIESFTNSAIRKINIQPQQEIIHKLSLQYVLKGADLWHLSTTKTIQSELHEVQILTFDKQLMSAAKKEGLLLH